MRINILQSLFLAPAVLVAAALTAQPALAATRVNIPFNFVAAGTACPAGIYTVDEANYGNALRLQGATQSLVWIAGPGAPSPAGQRVILSFDRVGSAHLLRTVQVGNIVTSRLDKNVREAIPAPEQTVVGQ